MERRIQEADGHRAAVHRLVHGLEVALLIGQDLGQGLLAVLDVVGNDHLAHGLDAVALEEHVLGAAQADALSAEVDGLLRRRGGCRRWCRPSACGTVSAQPMKRPKSPEMEASTVGMASP